jgi:hypothetical protein
MNIKNVSKVLLFMTSFFLDARWRVSTIDLSNSDLSSAESTAFYGKDSSLVLEPLTDLLRNSSNQIISIPELFGDVGTDSLGFNQCTFHAPDRTEYAILFDGQNAFRLQQGRVKAAALDPELGRYTSELHGFVARAEFRDDQDYVLHSHTQSYLDAGTSFRMIISGEAGNYNLRLEPESESN